MAREDRWRDDRRWDFDEEAREMRRRPDYGQADRSDYERRSAERRYWDEGYPGERRPYGDEAEARRRAARAERYGRDEDDYRRQEERAFRPFGTTGPTAYGAGADPYAWNPTYNAAYGSGAFPGYTGPYAAGPGRREPLSDRYTPSPREARGEEPRSFVDKARDEVASWFGDGDAERRRRGDEMRAEHRGRGPKSYRRSDERIREDINDRLTDDAWLDATDIEVAVKGGDVTLSGFVASREDKRRAERLVEDVGGVGDVQNNLRLRREGDVGAMSGQTKTAGNF